MFDGNVKFPLVYTSFCVFGFQVNFMDCITAVKTSYSVMNPMKKEETSKSLAITLMPEYLSSNQILFPVVYTSLFLDYESDCPTYFE